MTSNNAFGAHSQTCIVSYVVVTNESNTASYFQEEWNLNCSYADMCSDVAEPSSSITFDFGFSSRSRTFNISPTTSTAGRHLGIGRDYNSNTAFRGVLRHYA